MDKYLIKSQRILSQHSFQDSLSTTTVVTDNVLKNVSDETTLTEKDLNSLTQNETQFKTNTSVNKRSGNYSKKKKIMKIRKIL